MTPEGAKYSSDLGQNRAPLVQNEGLHERHGRQTAPLSYWTKAYYPAFPYVLPPIGYLSTTGIAFQEHDATRMRVAIRLVYLTWTTIALFRSGYSRSAG